MKKSIVLRVIPLLIFLLIWEAAAYFQKDFSVFFSSPSKIISLFYKETISGTLLYHTLITAFEAIVGLILGLVVGCGIGFSFVYYPKCSRIAYPYVLALSAIPTFALAPLMIIWFGTGLQMKIILAFLATVFTATFQTYEGAKKISVSDQLFFEINQASNKQRFWLLSFPASMDWVIQSMKLNAGFCLLGAFIGEFIASEAGLGYLILKASGLYDTTSVFVALICIIILSSIFSISATLMNKNKIKMIRFATQLALREDRRTKPSS